MRFDYRTALIASAASNAPHYQRKDKKPFTPQDFLPSTKPRVPQTVQQMAAIIEANNAALGGVDMRKQVIGASEEEKAGLLKRLRKEAS